MTTDQVRFGRPDRTMVGVLQWPDDEREAHGPAFVLCKPFGTEAIRAQILYRAMANRLAREGCAVLVYDAHGCGESPGEGRDQSLAHWRNDLLTADFFLRERTGAAPVHWFGLGLGGTLAALAADVAPLSQRPHHLLAWEPVEDGLSYGRRMCEWHRTELEISFKSRWSVLKQDFAMAEPSLPGMVLGFEIGTTLAAELAALRGLPLQALADAGVRLTVARLPQSSQDGQDGRNGQDGPAHQAGLDQAGSGRSGAAQTEAPAANPRLRTLRVTSAFNWLSNHPPRGEAYRGVEIVPQEIVNAALEIARHG